MESSEGQSINLAPKFELKLSDTVKQELGPQNLENLTAFTKTLKNQTDQQRIDSHLVLVGGNVNPQKQGKFHKDIDLAIYGSEFTVDPSVDQDNTKFNHLTEILTKIVTPLNWQTTVKEPYFQDWHYRFDGSITLIPPSGVPLEIIPTSLHEPYEKILERKKLPFLILF